MHMHLSPSYTPAFAPRYCSYKGRVNFHDNWLSSDIVWLIGAGWRKKKRVSIHHCSHFKISMRVIVNTANVSFPRFSKPETWAASAAVGWREWPFHLCRGGKSPEEVTWSVKGPHLVASAEMRSPFPFSKTSISIPFWKSTWKNKLKDPLLIISNIRSQWCHSASLGLDYLQMTLHWNQF